jgi:hypothetical protein
LRGSLEPFAKKALELEVKRGKGGPGEKTKKEKRMLSEMVGLYRLEQLLL